MKHKGSLQTKDHSAKNMKVRENTGTVTKDVTGLTRTDVHNQTADTLKLLQAIKVEIEIDTLAITTNINKGAITNQGITTEKACLMTDTAKVPPMTDTAEVPPMIDTTLEVPPIAATIIIKGINQEVGIDTK